MGRVEAAAGGGGSDNGRLVPEFYSVCYKYGINLICHTLYVRNNLHFMNFVQVMCYTGATYIVSHTPPHNIRQ